MSDKINIVFDTVIITCKMVQFVTEVEHKDSRNDQVTSMLHIRVKPDRPKV